MTSTVEKTNINNVKDNKNIAEKKMIVIGQLKKSNFIGKNHFSYFFVPFHVVHTLRNLFRNRFAPLFERSGTAPINVTDSIRAVSTRSLSATKIVSQQRHLSEKYQNGPRFSENFYYSASS